jgi:hypothetical protein
MDKYQQVVQTQIVDVNTGEVMEYETQKVFTKKIKNDHFYMTYIDFISPLFNLRTDTAKSVLEWMCCRAEYNTGKVALTTSARKELCEHLDISPNTLTNNLKKLKDLKIISGEKGEFIINPQIFWKGDSQSRDNMLNIDEIKLTFDIITK